MRQGEPCDDSQLARAISEEALTALRARHERMAERFGRAIASWLRCPVEVRLASVVPISYSELVFALPGPTCFHVLRAEPLAGPVLLEISPAILGPIIDRLLGDDRASAGVGRRPMTEIELRFADRLHEMFFREFRRAWRSIVSLKPKIVQTESNPLRAQAMGPREQVLVFRFELAVGVVCGAIHLGVPAKAIEPLAEKLSS